MENARAIFDRMDARILRLLQTDAAQGHGDIAGALKISSEECSARIKRLEGAGVIKSYVSIVDCEAVGVALVAFVAVTLENQSNSDLEFFEAQIIKNPAVQECVALLGDESYLLKIVLTSIDEFAGLRRRILKITAIAEMNTFFAFKTVKREIALPWNLYAAAQ